MWSAQENNGLKNQHNESITFPIDFSSSVSRPPFNVFLLSLTPRQSVTSQTFCKSQYLSLAIVCMPFEWLLSAHQLSNYQIHVFQLPCKNTHLHQAAAHITSDALCKNIGQGQMTWNLVLYSGSQDGHMAGESILSLYPPSNILCIITAVTLPADDFMTDTTPRMVIDYISSS